jgi:hypothetical protein
VKAHGPGIGIERWVGPADGNLSALPMTAAWRRPFRSRVQSSRWFGEGGVIFRDWHVWYNKETRDLLGLPAYRLAGYRSVANSEFSTQAFVMPHGPLWINADAHWEMDSDDACSEGCAAYLMVAALDAHSGALLPGYDRGRCVMMNVNATRLELAWNGSTPLHEVHGGKQIRLRIYYRDAAVYAVGAY